MAKRKDVLALVEKNRQETIELLQDFVRTVSVNPRYNPKSPGEGAMGAKVKTWLEKIGFTVTVKEFEPSRPNIVAVKKGRKSRPRLLINAHMDTVDARPAEIWPDPETGEILTGWSVDPFGGEIKNGVLYGRGSCDHKGPLAAMLAAAKALHEADVDLEGDLIFVADSDEETGSEAGLKRIAPELMTQGIDHAFYALTTDFTPLAREYFTDMDECNVIHAALGFQEYTVRVTAPVYHTVAPVPFPGAIPETLKLIAAIEEFAEEVNQYVPPATGPGHKLMQVMGIYSTQDTPLFPAHSCDIRVGRYYGPDEDPDRVARQFRDFVEKQAQDLGIKIEVNTSREMPALATPVDDPLVQITKAAVEEVRGKTPRVAGLPVTVGLTQAGINAPAVLFGFGSINFHHAFDERIKVEDLVDTAKVYALIFMDYLGIADR